MTTYFEEHDGYIASVHGEDGKWAVNLVQDPTGGTICQTADLFGQTMVFSYGPYPTIEEAQHAAHEEFKNVIGKPGLVPQWKRK